MVRPQRQQPSGIVLDILVRAKCPLSVLAIQNGFPRYGMTISHRDLITLLMQLMQSGHIIRTEDQLGELVTSQVEK